MVTCKHRLIFMVFCLSIFLGSSQTWSATIHAELDRKKVNLNESFTLVYGAEGSVDGEPNFRVIEENFDILQKSEGNRVEIINGDITRKREWTLTLMGKEAGFFTIPPIAFGKDQSPALRIDIEKTPVSEESATAELLFLEVKAEPTTGYVQSQFVYTLRFYRAVNLLSAQLSEPTLSDADAVIEKLGEDKQFETTRNGERYRVVERKYAIFPQQSGTLSIAPISFAGQLAGSARSQFNPFPGGGPIKRLRSEQMTLKVQPVPQDKIKGRWLPARKLQLLESWPEVLAGEPTGKVGEPLTWTIQLMAEGLTAAQLPELNPVIPEDFKAYPDQPVLKNETQDNGLLGIRQEKIALIPTKAGTLLLPALEVPWWNTKTEKVEIALLPARRIQVAPADLSQRRAAPLPPQKAPEIQTPQGNTLPAPLAQNTLGIWPWVSLALAVAWGLTLVGWRQTHKKTQQRLDSKDRDTRPPDIGPIKKQLQKACTQNDAHAAKDALLIWGRVMWPGQPVSLGEIGNRVGQSLSNEIKKLNAVLYSQTETSWETGPSLWTAFEEETRNSKKATPKPEALVPLYPSEI